MKTVLIKTMNEMNDKYKNRGYDCVNTTLSTMACIAGMALGAGLLSHADYAEVMEEYAKLYGEALKAERDRIYEVLKKR